MIYFLFVTLLSMAQEGEGNASSQTMNPMQDSSDLFSEEAEGSIVKRLTEPFNYEREGRRDPFVLPEAKKAPLLPGSYFGPFLPLQEVHLSDVTIKGIIEDPVKPTALIAFKNYKGKEILKKVGVGDYLGENFGVIQAIRDGKIIIVQTFGEGDKKSTSTITLSIRK
ncbi:MAG: pilus assembly protein PilP [Bdellovibrionaceae bacterium]|nr:pilus assembly protein PilP [Pseudobdellovibrionaceae bacterium]